MIQVKTNDKSQSRHDRHPKQIPSKRNTVITASVKEIENYKHFHQTEQCLYFDRKNHDINICREFVKIPLFQEISKMYKIVL